MLLEILTKKIDFTNRNDYKKNSIHKRKFKRKTHIPLLQPESFTKQQESTVEQPPRHLTRTLFLAFKAKFFNN